MNPLLPVSTCSYLNAIQTCCPHIFRYITAAVITNKKRQVLLKDLVKVIKHVSVDCPVLFYVDNSLLFSQESYSYSDPITEFVECLYVNFDFDLAQQKLIECEKVKSLILVHPPTLSPLNTHSHTHLIPIHTPTLSPLNTHSHTHFISNESVSVPLNVTDHGLTIKPT